MERRKALAAASAATLVLGSTIVAAASVSGATFLGFGGASRHGPGSFAVSAPGAAAKQRVVVRTRDIYDQYVVDSGSAAGGHPGGTAASTANGPTPAAPALVVGPSTPPTSSTPGDPPEEDTRPPAKHHSTSPTTEPVAGATTPTTSATVLPGPVTTVPATPTTLPRGVPHDWPPGKPIPPMPPHCQQPQLELNGVWNCQSDD